MLLHGKFQITGRLWANIYHDLALKKPVEQYLGIQYNTCCWAAGIGARRYVTSRQHQDEDSVLYDHGIGFTLELRGLGTNNYQKWH